MKELQFEELTTQQKLGMTFTALLHRAYRPDYEWVYDMIRQRSLGAVWIQAGVENSKEYIAKVREIADYPILIITDAESGIGGFYVGSHNAVGCTGSEKHAYAFGKTIGVTARQMGYSVVCNPVVDMINGSPRSLGTNKEQVASLAAAIARGMHDGGVLTVGKHYPGGTGDSGIDSHMMESVCSNSKEELLEYSLYPYLKLDEESLLDGIMISHKKYINIDPNRPGTLSKPVVDIIREQNYDGFIITDALSMMGIRANYDDVTSKGLAMGAGVDLLLPYEWNNPEQFGQYVQAYEKGMVPEDMLDRAVKRVLKAQHNSMLLPKDAVLTEEEIQTFRSINKDGVYTRTDEGLDHTISRDGKHYFAIVVNQETDIGADGKVAVDTFSGGWCFPTRITQKIETLFPNSCVQIIHQFPTPKEVQDVLNKSIGYEDVVFMTFAQPMAYTGPAHLTRRIISLITALQATKRISTVVHVGTPRVLEELPHIPRFILGGLSSEGVDACFDVLAGEYPANGTPTFEFHLQ